jgi:hypothetical protein
MSTFPSVISTITNPIATQRLNSPSHSSIESAQNDGINKLETFVGTLSSTQGTLMYDIRAAASNGGGHIQSANKGGTGQTSFTKGDILVATSSSVIAKVAIGNNNDVLIADSTQNAGLKWSVFGVNQGGTGINGGYTKGDLIVATSSSVLAKLAIGTDGQFLTPSSVQAAGIKWDTLVYNFGITTKNLTDNNGSVQTIAHGLGRVPSKLAMIGFNGSTNTSAGLHTDSRGSYDGTNQKFISVTTGVGNAAASNSGTSGILQLGDEQAVALQLASAAFDATNITLTWSKVNSPNSTAQIFWEVWGY